MSSRLLNQSLGQLAQNDRHQSSGAASRSSPYTRSDRSATSSDGAWKHDMFDAHNQAAGSRGGHRGASGARSGTAPALKPTAKLTIENLHYEVSEAELRDLFERIGPVVKAFVKYDRSGRSTGQAVVIYESVDDAATAQSEYDGAKAKGQVISITQEMRAERPPRSGTNHSNNNSGATASAAASGSASRSSGKDFLSRFDLLSRLGGPRPESLRNASRGAAASNNSHHAHASGSGRSGGRPGPQRSVSGAGGRGSSGRGGGGGQREKRKPATQADLDAELEAFMKAPASVQSQRSQQQATAQPAVAAAPVPPQLQPQVVAPNSTAASIHAPPTEDVEMA
ncbi:hypothetical protein ACQY0O_006476 [Thecaphora frezii]